MLWPISRGGSFGLLAGASAGMAGLVAFLKLSSEISLFFEALAVPISAVAFYYLQLEFNLTGRVLGRTNSEENRAVARSHAGILLGGSMGVLGVSKAFSGQAEWWRSVDAQLETQYVFMGVFGAGFLLSAIATVALDRSRTHHKFLELLPREERFGYKRSVSLGNNLTFGLALGFATYLTVFGLLMAGLAILFRKQAVKSAQLEMRGAQKAVWVHILSLRSYPMTVLHLDIGLYLALILAINIPFLKISAHSTFPFVGVSAQDALFAALLILPMILAFRSVSRRDNRPLASILGAVIGLMLLLLLVVREFLVLPLFRAPLVWFSGFGVPDSLLAEGGLFASIALAGGVVALLPFMISGYLDGLALAHHDLVLYRRYHAYRVLLLAAGWTGALTSLAIATYLTNLIPFEELVQVIALGIGLGAFMMWNINREGKRRISMLQNPAESLTDSEGAIAEPD